MQDISLAFQRKKEYNIMLTEYTNELRKRSEQEMIEKFAELRDFPLDIVQKTGIFYVREMAEMLLPNYLDKISKLGVISPTNNKPIFNNRYIIPIYNADGLVENLVGYSKDANERYIYGTAEYYSRTDTLWGLENLNIAYELGYAILVEGITDAIRIRSMGFPNTFAMCGTHKSEHIISVLNRCRYGVIRIPDRDRAGLQALQGWEYNRSVTLYTNLRYKDPDEMCRESEENRELFKAYLNDCINWLKTEEHKGKKCLCESVTIL